MKILLDRLVVSSKFLKTVEQVGALRLTSRSTLLARKGKTLTGRAVWRAAAASMVFSSKRVRIVGGHYSDTGASAPMTSLIFLKSVLLSKNQRAPASRHRR